MKYLFAVLAFALVLSGCGGGNLVAPSSVSDPNPSMTLPGWLFAYDNKLVRPKPGTYGVYLSPEIADSEAAAHLEQMMAAATNLTHGEVRFVRSMDPSAPIKFRIDSGSTQGNQAYGMLSITTTSYCVSVSTAFRDRASVMSNTSLHELGHFLFGPGHSDAPDDIMTTSRNDFNRPRFSEHEYQLWDQAHQIPVGSRQ